MVNYGQMHFEGDEWKDLPIVTSFVQMKPARITGNFRKIKRTPEHQILETLALLAEGNRISSLTRAKGYKEDTILEWLREAAVHAEQVEAVLMRDFKVKRGQLDALWAYVGRKKGQSGG